LSEVMLKSINGGTRVVPDDTQNKSLIEHLNNN